MAAINNFKLTIDRAKKLVDLHKELCPIGKPKTEYSDILRAAVVVSVSAIDGYFHEKIPENIPRLVRARKGRNLPGKLIDVIKAGASHEKLIGIMFEEHRLSHIVSIVRNSMKDRTYQDGGKIEDAIKLLGIDDLWYNLGQKMKLSKEKAKTHVQDYVERRHQIVHRGDYGQTKKAKNTLKRISRSYAERCAGEVSRFVEAIEAVVESTISTMEKKK